jgi:F-type H+-transporting ATPase subunit gamma
MAKARAIVKRRKAVRNIRKITQTMQLIATARFQKCLQRAVAGRPYTEKLTEMIQALRADPELDHPLLRPNEGVPTTILLTITSNRGLCGAYNAALLRVAVAHVKKLRQAGLAPELETVGKKGVSYYRFLGYPVSLAITDVEDRIAYARVAEMAERYIRRYAARQIARLEVAYTRFHSASSQRPAIVQVLPMQSAAAGEELETGGLRPEFEFSPPAGLLLGRLLPEAVKVRLYQCFNDAIVSEQVSRMVAMRAATEAAGEMIRYLTREYNRARQTQITMELADIVGGAEAVK